MLTFSFFRSSKLVDQIEKKLIARDKGKKNDFSSKRNSNIVSSSDKKESSNVLSIFHDTIKSSLDNEFFKREEKVNFIQCFFH